MTLVVLLGLAALWAAVLLPPLLKSRASRSVSSDSIGAFNYRLDVLSRTNGAAPRRRRPQPATAPAAQPVVVHRPMPVPRSAAKRRADVLRVLVIAIALTMALAYFTGSPLVWGVQILADVMLVAFLGLWAWVRNAQADHARTVRYLPQRRAPELAFRRTASS